jgi:hypothetical protein
MGSVSTLFQQGGFFQQNAGSLASIGQAATQLVGGLSTKSAAGKNAKLLRRQGKAAETEIRREGLKLRGAQRARFASAGVDPNTGTPLDVVLESEEQARLAARRRRMAFESEADIQERAGSIAAIQGLFGAGSTLLGALRQPDPPKKRASLPKTQVT